MPRPEIANWIQEVFEVKEDNIFAFIDKTQRILTLDDDNEYADDTDDLRMK